MNKKLLPFTFLLSCFQQLPSNLINITIIILGSILRLRQYLENRSFWLDEAWLALDISTRTFHDIFWANLFNIGLPIVPPGFAGIEKSLITLLGNNEYVLRLFPFLCGVASLFVFYRLLKISVPRKVISVALGFFAFSNLLIYQSGELKQYSSDVFMVLLLYLLMFN